MTNVHHNLAVKSLDLVPVQYVMVRAIAQSVWTWLGDLGSLVQVRTKNVSCGLAVGEC